MLRKLQSAIAKEIRIILRDKEALAILFILPAIFVLIMSLALQDAFNKEGSVKFSMLLINEDKGDIGEQIDKTFSGLASFKLETLKKGEALPNDAELQDWINEGKYQFAIRIPVGSTKNVTRRAEEQMGFRKGGKTTKTDIILFADPALRSDHRNVLVNALNRTLQGIETQVLLKSFAAFTRKMEQQTGASLPKQAKSISLFTEVKDPYEDRARHKGPTPTSVQQNAPGWGLLAMFFLVIPLAGTLVKEQQQGSLLRLQTMSAPISLLLAGKIVPYFVINQIQIGLILLEGVYLLPLLGGERLELGNAPGAIVLLSVTISLAAIGYGLMVAAFCRTAEQATVFGATSVLILGALGGIMVPKLVMPPAMQSMTAISPMSWGLDGFLEIFVRGAGAYDILDKAGMLVVFGLICLIAGILRFRYRLYHR